MQKYKINGWDEWQSYRKDRGAPPWIKVHRSLMTNPKWASLTDAEKGQLVSLWIAAADNNGELPYDVTILRKICQLDSNPNLSKFKALGFIDDNVVSSGCQDDANMTHQRREEERREELLLKEKKYTKKEKPDDVTEEVWQDFVIHRKAKKATITATALAGIRREAVKAGWSMDRALAECCARGWVGFKAEWVEKGHIAPSGESSAQSLETTLNWYKNLLNKRNFNIMPEYRMKEKIAELEAKIKATHA